MNRLSRIAGRARVFVVTAALCFAAAAVSRAVQHSVWLDSGETVIGEIRADSPANTLTLESALLGTLEIELRRVVAIEAVGESGIEMAPVEGDKTAPVQELGPTPPAIAEAIPPEPEAGDAVPVADAATAAKTEEDELAERRAWWAPNYEFPENWQGDLRFGFNASTGGNKWQEGVFRGRLAVEDNSHLYRFNGYLNYRETEKDNGETFTSVDRYGGDFLFRKNYENDVFFQNFGAFRSDSRKGIFHELQNTLGLGYGFEPYREIEVGFGGGGGIRFSDTETRGTNGQHWITEVFQEFKWEPFQRTTLSQMFRYYLNPSRSDDYNYIFEAAFRYRLTELLGFEFSYELDFDNDVSDPSQKKEALWRNTVIVYF